MAKITFSINYVSSFRILIRFLNKYNIKMNLGPLLFLCYVNDMVTSIDSDCKLLLYANDSTILFSHKDPKVISEKLGKVLESCSSWLVDNKLSLHLGKTESILFGSKRKLSKVENFQIKCNEQAIESTKQVKYLGLNIDSNLSGESIVNNILGKVNARLKFLYRHGDCLSKQTRKTLSSALILCHFDYSCSAWYSGLNKSFKHKLQVAQNKVVRFINHLGPRVRVTNEMLSELNLLNVDTRVKQLKMNHVHKIVNNKGPAYMKEHFLNVNEIHKYQTRSNEHNFFISQCQGPKSQTFYYSAIKDWNDLHDHLKGIQNNGKFKAELKKFLHSHNHSKDQDDYLYY